MIFKLNNLIISDQELVTNFEQNEIKKILNEIRFEARGPSTTKKFIYDSHALVPRPVVDEEFNSNSTINIVSPYFDFFYSLVKKFCIKHKIKYSNIIRANINLTSNIFGYEYTDPHVDFSKPHYVILIYLNEISLLSSTIIFNKICKFKDKNFILDVDNIENKTLPIKKEIYPEFGKILAFDGKFYHSNRIPMLGENRLVCVFNLLK